MTKNSDRFLDAFIAIEKHLKRIVRRDLQNDCIPFYRLIEHASKRDAAVRNLFIDLQEYADLRNAIVHERTDSHVIAEPNDVAMQKIELMVKLITEPPKLRKFMTRNVCRFQASNPIATAAATLYKKKYSQAPVYNGEDFVGLLTTNTIARWLGANAKEEFMFPSETSIKDVLEYTEISEHVIFLKPDVSVYEVIERFHTYEANGKRLEAILVTNAGKPSEKLLGMLTIWDLLKLHKAIDISSI